MSTSADPKDAEMKAATARCKRSAACRRFQKELGGFEPPTSWVRFGRSEPAPRKLGYFQGIR